MSMQHTILRRYKEISPRSPLREISADTGIQLTRVFRLMNGKEMRLSEYELFEAAIERKEHPSAQQFLELSRRCLMELPADVLLQVKTDMDRRLHRHALQMRIIPSPLQIA